MYEHVNNEQLLNEIQELRSEVAACKKQLEAMAAEFKSLVKMLGGASQTVAPLPTYNHTISKAVVLQAFMACAEKTLHYMENDEGNKPYPKIRGWTTHARGVAKFIVNKFVDENSQLLEEYCKHYSDFCIGHDLWLAVSEPEASLISFGDELAFLKLQDAANKLKKMNVYRTHQGWLDISTEQD